MGWILVGILILCAFLTGKGSMLFNAILLIIGLSAIVILAIVALHILTGG